MAALDLVLSPLRRYGVMDSVMRYGVMALLGGLALWRYGVMTFEQELSLWRYGVIAIYGITKEMAILPW